MRDPSGICTTQGSILNADIHFCQPPWQSKPQGDCLKTEITLLLSITQIRGSIVVSISARHAEDPGSIPGRGASCTDRAHHNGQALKQPRPGQCATHASGFARRAPVLSAAAAGCQIGRQGAGHVQSGMGHALHRFAVLGARGRWALGLLSH